MAARHDRHVEDVHAGLMRAKARELAATAKADAATWWIERALWRHAAKAWRRAVSNWSGLYAQALAVKVGFDLLEAEARRDLKRMGPWGRRFE